VTSCKEKANNVVCVVTCETKLYIQYIQYRRRSERAMNGAGAGLVLKRKPPTRICLFTPILSPSLSLSLSLSLSGTAWATSEG
jgi:hypothetical protein